MDNFQIFVKPVGAQCNLACGYCYYLEKQNLYPDNKNLRMSDELLEEYIIQHIRASEGPEIFFSWHGGEPTMAGLKFYRQVVAFQKKHLPKNFRLLNGMQTNGTLLDDEWCRFLKKENFIVGISLDGPEEYHSVHRSKRDGKSSFSEVIRGFQLLKKYNVPCEILCVVNSTNVRYPLEVYRFFKSLNVRFMTFLPLVEKQLSIDTIISERSVPTKAFGEFLCTIFDEWESSDIGNVKIQIVEEALRTAFGLEHSLCIFKSTCGEVPVVESNGDFYSCDHYVDQEHLVGNITQTSLDQLLESDQQREFGNAKRVSLPDYCRSCEVLAMCNGACPKDRFLSTPDGEQGLNYLCEGYKLFFNHCKPFVEQVAEAWKNNSKR
ncbi:MAG: anaerobic sulfatase maturase [Mariniphaga sp.]